MSSSWSSAVMTTLMEVAAGRTHPLPSIHVAGAERPAASGATFETIDPSSEATLAHVARGDAQDIDAAAIAAREALAGPWGKMSPQDRHGALMTLAAAIEDHAGLLARLETLDCGKPLSASAGDVAGAVATLRYNAGAADKMHGITVPLGPDFVDFTELVPLGVTGHITPWNFPLGMAMRSLAPALAAGCTAILKPAEQTPLTTLALAEIAIGAGIPPGVINVVTGLGEEAGAALTAHPLVSGITFTGSVETGRIVGAEAGRTLKSVVLELGGKNPMIVFADADLDRAVEAAIEGGFDNTGQVCSSSSRLVVERSVKDAFLGALVARARTLVTAPGLDDRDLGPLVSAEQHGKVMDHIAAARGDGARTLLGGARPAGLDKGYFVAPTVFDEVDPASRIAREETFGPVVTAFAFDTEDEAIALANALPYGLNAGLQTRDIDRALECARRLEAGSVWINGWFIGGVQAPTGGIKDSGTGRERGLAGIMNYLTIKNIGIALKRDRA
ncbi:MAG: aldehyde dehydrogenase DhaS [Acuticoccus sp.]